MGKVWDNTGIANDKTMWAECLRVLKPGGHLLAFSGTRTYHRMACAIEDAGFEVRDMIEYVYGSGFPKSLNIGKAVDKRKEWNKYKDFANELKIKRKQLNLTKKQAFDLCKFEAQTFGGNSWFEDGRIPSKKDYKLLKSGLELDNSFDLLFDEVEREFIKNDKNWGQKGTVPVSGYGEFEITKGISAWEGWGTALKPAHEPICMARKPLSEKTVAENVLKYGTGGINIDESRVGTEERYNAPAGNKAGGNSLNMSAVGMPQDVDGTTSVGRFPANLIHDNSEEVRECFPETKSGKMTPQHTRHTDGSPNGIYGKFDANHPLSETIGDSGNASRFFKSIIYTAKASKTERQKGCEDLYILKDGTPEDIRKEIETLLDIAK